MADWDPTKDGATLATAKPAEGEWNPAADGYAALDRPGPDQDSSPTHNLGTDFAHYYGGLEGMDQRLSPDQRKVFAKLDAVSDNSKEARAQAINQAYLSSQFDGLPHSMLERNWEAVKVEYAKHAFGSVDSAIPDVKLYGMISKRMTEEQAMVANKFQGDEFGENRAKPWTIANPVVAGAQKFGEAIHGFNESLMAPIIKIPEAPKDLPDMPGMGLNNPALVGAVFNGFVKPTLEGIESPFGIATLGVGTELQAAAKLYPAAKVALLSMEGVFAGLMLHNTIQAGMEVHKLAKDPNATFQDKATAASSMVGNGALTLLGALGPALEMFPKEKSAEVTKSLEGKNPAEAAAILWWEASQTDVHGQQFFLEDAAKKMEALATPEQKAAATANSPRGTNPAETVQPVPAGPAKAGAEVLPNMPRGADEGTAPAAGAGPKKGVAAVQGPPELVTVKPEVIGIKNAAVDAQLKELGKEAGKHGEPTTDEAEFAKAKAITDADPLAGQKLVDAIHDNPKRAVSTTEVAVLAREAMRASLEREAAEEQLNVANESGDQAEKMDATLRVARAKDAYEKTLRASDLAGTSQAQAFRIRQRMIRRDYSLAAQERSYKAAAGRELTAGESKNIADLTKQLAEANAKVEAYDKAAKEAAANPVREAPRRPKPPSKVTEFISKQAAGARERIRARMGEGRVQAGLDPADLADHAIVGAEFISKGVTKFADWSVAMVNELGETIRPYLQDIFKQAIDAEDQARRLQAYKQRTATAIEKGKEKLVAGDLSKTERKKLQMDREAINLRAESERIKRKIDLGRQELEQAARTPLEKAKDLALAVNRAGVLSRVGTILKLSAIIAERTVTTPIRQGIGLAASKVLPGVARQARFEDVPTVGGYVRSEAKAITAMLTKGLPGAWDILRMKDTDLQALLEKEHLPPGALSYPSHIHSALHYPVQVADYARRLQLINERDIRARVDLTEPVNQLKNMQEAWEYSKRSVFLQDNKLVNAYKAALGTLQSPDKATGKPNPVTNFIALGLQIENPVLKVPANFAQEVTEHVLGLLDPLARLALKGVGGFKGLSYGEADMILRHIKNGSLGAAMVLLGFFKYKQVGGFYQEGERRKEGDAQAGEIKAGKVTVPKLLLEDTSVQAMMAGATMHRTLDSVYRLNDPQKKGIPAALLAVAAGLTEETPFIRDATLIGKFLDPRQREHAVAADIASHIVPGFVQELAAEMDKKNAYNPFEKPNARAITAPDFIHALGQNLKKETPGLRQTLPARNVTTSLRE